MVIPSIDLQGGSTVQLVGGRDKALDAGDPRPLLRRFSIAGEVAVIDLDAAIGTGSNAALIEELVKQAPCRVGGGIRSVDAAIRWLDAGASKVILGTAATPEILKELPRERVIAAVDCNHGEVVVKGWREGTGEKVEDRIARLRDHVGSFLITFVEREGRMVGIDTAQIERLVKAADTGRPDSPRVTIAGGIATAEEIGIIDRLGADAQVGMGLYTGRFTLHDAVLAPTSSDRPDGLLATVVVDELGHALGLCYSSRESVAKAIELQRGVYHSRRRGVWVKGETSGDTQELLRIDLDCDRDALRFVVRQRGNGFCHLKTDTCWGNHAGLAALERTVRQRLAEAPTGSYTRRLLDDPALLRAKLIEEAGELATALDPSKPDSRGTGSAAANEAADLIYFALVALAKADASLADVGTILDARSRKVTRRPGNAKPSH